MKAEWGQWQEAGFTSMQTHLSPPPRRGALMRPPSQQRPKQDAMGRVCFASTRCGSICWRTQMFGKNEFLFALYSCPYQITSFFMRMLCLLNGVRTTKKTNLTLVLNLLSWSIFFLIFFWHLFCGCGTALSTDKELTLGLRKRMLVDKLSSSEVFQENHGLLFWEITVVSVLYKLNLDITKGPH